MVKKSMPGRKKHCTEHLHKKLRRWQFQNNGSVFGTGSRKRKPKGISVYRKSKP